MAPAAGKCPPFLKTCDAYVKMVEMLESGEIDAAESPKLAYQKHPLFQLHDLAAFRAGLNKYKAMNGYYTRNGNAGGVNQNVAPNIAPPPGPPQGEHDIQRCFFFLWIVQFLTFICAFYHKLQEERTQRLL
jgi:hypothetical protein